MTSLLSTRFGNSLLTIAACGALLLSPSAARAQGLDALVPRGYVNDFALALSPETRDQLSKVCVELDDRAHAQIAIVTLHSLDGVDSNAAAAQLYKRWVIGYPPEDRGAMVLMLVNEHKSAVKVGAGLESVLPTAKLSEINRQAEKLLAEGDNNRATLYLTGEVARIIGADKHVALASQPDVQINPPSSLTLSFGGTAGTVVLVVLVVLVCGVLFLVALSKLAKSQGSGSRTSSGGGVSAGSPGGFGGGGGFGGFGGDASSGGATGA